MKKVNYIIELANGKLSSDGYAYIVSLLKYYLNKFSWPKTILDERASSNNSWNDEDALSFAQQFLVYVLEKEKLKNISNIPQSYIEYYFKTIIVSYVANKIKAYQNKLGLSFDDTKRVTLEILKDQYISKEIKNEMFWNNANTFSYPLVDVEEIHSLASKLPNIPINENTKHYKPLVKMALSDLFTLINRPMKQSVLIDRVFKLFDQSSFSVIDDDDVNEDVREEQALKAIDLTLDKLEQKDYVLYLDYYFSATKKSMSDLSKKYNIPKSTIHHKIKAFTSIVADSFSPENEKEGIWFMENLHKTLDKLK